PPHEMFQVVVDRRDLFRIWKVNVLRCNVGSFGETGIIARQNVAPPAIEAIGVVRSAQHLVLHVVHGVQAVVPLRRVSMLLPMSYKPRALLNQSFKRFGGEELQISSATTVVMDSEPVFTEAFELDLI